MKKIFFIAIAIMGVTQFTYAQEQNKFRVGLDLGYAIPDGGGGILIGLEPKYNIADNMSVGLRFEAAVLAKNISNSATSLEAKVGTNSSYYGTFDYYFHNGSSSFAPFVGGGIGYNALANLEVDIDILGETNTAGVGVDGKFGGLLRAGFELGKFRLAASYNLIGKTEIEGSETKNSYFGISLGFYVGGGKWKK